MKTCARLLAAAALLVVVALITSTAAARVVRAWTYDELRDESDLIAIVTPTARKELPDKTTLPGIFRQTKTDRESIEAIQVETTFKVISTLKGRIEAGKDADKKNEFILYHMIESKPDVSTDGPDLVDFKPDSKKTYLMYLKKRPDGRYEATNGNTDPATSIKELVASPTP